MKRVLAILDLKPRQAHNNVVESMEAACSRWGVDFVRVTEPIADGTVFYQKLRLPKRIKDTVGDCRVLQMDNDMVIRDDMPSPFDIVGDDQIGFAATRDRGFHQQRFVWSSHRHWAGKLGIPISPVWAHPNGGLWMYNTQSHAEMIEFVGTHSAFDRQTLYKIMDEATMINAAWKFHREQLYYLPQRFNTILADWPFACTEDRLMTYCYHYVASIKSRIPSAIWQTNNQAVQYRFSTVAGVHLSTLIKTHQHGQLKRGIELGVLRGNTSFTVLANCPEVELYGVDMWAPYANDPENPEGDWHQLDSQTRRSWRGINDAMWLLGCNADRWKPIKETSQRAVRLFDDRELDFVFLDTSYDYESVKANLETWAPKVRSLGVLAGGEYTKERPGVIKAVVEFLQQRPNAVFNLGEHSFWSITLP